MLAIGCATFQISFVLCSHDFKNHHLLNAILKQAFLDIIYSGSQDVLQLHMRYYT